MTLLEAPRQQRSHHPHLVTASSSGLDPDRVLVFGDALFPAGERLVDGARAVADALASASGRGADVTVVPWGSWCGETLTAAGGAMDFANYDVVVVTLADSVVHRRTTTSAIADSADDVLAMIDQLRPRLATTSRVVVALTHSGDQSALAARLEASGEGLVVVTVDDDPAASMPRVLAVTQLLLAHQRAAAASPQWLRSRPQPVERRYAAVRDLGMVDEPADAHLDRIVANMARLFGTAGAAITLLPEGQQWSVSSRWFPRGSGALQDSFCRTTVLSSDPFVVGDAWQGTQVVPRNDIRFYAGYPLEAPDGTRLGAVCVFDPAPRDPASVELHLLRDFAILVRDTLYRGGRD